MKQKSLKKNAIYSFIKAFMTLIFPIITFPYASRVLLPKGIGMVNFANSIVSYFVMIAGLGISGYATREASRLRNDKISLSKFCKEILTINFISTGIAYILFIIALLFIPKLHDYKILLLVSSSSILFTTIGIDWFYTSQEEFKYITIRSFIFQIISLVFLFTFVRSSKDYVLYMIFGIISSVGSNVCNFLYSRKYIDFKQKCHLELKKHIKPIFVFFGMSVVTSIYTMLDTTMLGFLTNDTEVGYYSAATKINKMVMSLLASIVGILLPRLTYYAEKKDKDSFVILAEKSFNIVLLLAPPCTAGLFILAKPLVLLFSGNEYLPAVITMKTMTPLIFIMSLGSLIGGQLLPSIRKEKYSLISYICGATINIIANSILIPIYKSLGAGIATVLAEFSVTFIQVIFCIKNINLKPAIKNILLNLLQAIAATLIMSFIVILIINFIKNIILQILFSIIFGAITYGLILLLFHNTMLISILMSFKTKFCRK